jgi:23S rRNA (pseudouridine1915-N3)-methyltransferase
MNISIVAVGKIKEKYLVSGIKEYQKRLSGYCKLNIIEVPDRQAPENLSPAQLEEVINQEGQDIMRNIRTGSHMIALDIKGKKMSSEKMAQYMNRLAITGSSNVTFVIGGSNGLSQEVLQKAGLRLSFSDMTFPHQLMRLILLEQIYRWFRIMRGEPYHK